MTPRSTQSEIRQSQIRDLLEKVRRQSYGQYLLSVNLQKARAFTSATVQLAFPVTALIGPNGGGKSTILGAAACAFKSVKPGTFFPKSAIGDDSMADWGFEYELIDRKLSCDSAIRRSSKFRRLRWVQDEVVDRPVHFFGIDRTVQAAEKGRYKKLMRSSYQHTGASHPLENTVATETEKILGKSVQSFICAEIEADQDFYIGGDRTLQYSEFHFGAGEASIIRMVAAIESTPDNSLILIEEIENGLHPVATRRMVEYLISVAERKSIQAIFTTHSDFALDPLPSEAIWASIDGKAQQGKLSVEALRAVSGRVDKKLAIFVEDAFAKEWMEAMLRETLANTMDQIAVYAVSGDGNAVKIHRGHRENPAIEFTSLCFIDGDSRQQENPGQGIYRLPGTAPESTVFNDVVNGLSSNLAVLTVSCQRPPEKQEEVKTAINEVSSTNRDPHLLFNQVGIKIGWVSEAIVRGAFFAVWMRQDWARVENLVEPVRLALE